MILTEYDMLQLRRKEHLTCCLTLLRVSFLKTIMKNMNTPLSALKESVTILHKYVTLLHEGATKCIVII